MNQKQNESPVVTGVLTREQMKTVKGGSVSCKCGGVYAGEMYCGSVADCADTCSAMCEAQAT